MTTRQVTADYRASQSTCERPGPASGSEAAEACIDEKDAATAEVQFAEEPIFKVKGRLDPAVWATLSDLEKVRWPSEP